MRFRHSQNERCLANSILDIPYLVFLSVNMLYRYIDFFIVLKHESKIESPVYWWWSVNQ